MTLRVLLLFAHWSQNETLSYQTGWPRHFLRHRAFECVPLNVLDRRAVWRVRLRSRLRRSPFDAVVVLHSVFSNSPMLRPPLVEWVRELDAPKAYFIGNEYKLMPEKMRFCEDLGVDLLVSQFTDERPLQLYRARLGCSVVGIPNTGLDVELFASRGPREQRSIDVGYRAYRNPWYLGHDERAAIADRFQEVAPARGLRTDISLDPQARFTEPEWAAFLNDCRGQLGTEAGGDFFELTDETRLAVNRYLEDNPGATFEGVYRRFFEGYSDAVPGRALSGRIVEAAGTKTVQLLLEGAYGGYFRPDEHYIPVRKDFSNLDEALEKFADCDYCERITTAAYEVAVSELTYERLISSFAESLSGAMR